MTHVTAKIAPPTSRKQSYLTPMFPRPLTTLLLVLCSVATLLSQGSPLPTNDENYALIRRLLVKYGTEGFTAPATDLSLQPLNRASLVRLAKTYDSLYGDQMSAVERYRLQGFFDDNNEWLSIPDLRTSKDADRAAFYLGEGFHVLAKDSPLYRDQGRLLNAFYPTPANLLEVNATNFYLRLNPVLDFRYGTQSDDDEGYFYNRRGLTMRAGIDDRIFLHFDILETQLGLPNYIRRYRNNTGSLPGAGFLKEYSLGLVNVMDGNDFLNGQGYLSADITKHVGARLGYGNHFIGDGERSVLLSDFSNNYPYLELNWRIWKFHYRNVFAELTGEPQGTTPRPGVPLLKKYLAAHYLSINVGKRVTLGLFEAVVLNREDGFDLAYLNPIILYRTIEQSVGSPDNAMIGLTARYRSAYRVEVYGQMSIDEFKADELFVERRGWWANKWAYQLGARYVDAFGLDQLDLLVERNVARPFTYGHRGNASYTHFNLPLAHPLGANFNENIIGVDYRPLPRLHLRARLYLITQGESTGGPSAGENLNVSTNERGMDFEHEIGQGVSYSNSLLNVRASYELYPNLWLEGDFLTRDKASNDAARSLETTVINLGVRWNVARRDEAF